MATVQVIYFGLKRDIEISSRQFVTGEGNETVRVVIKSQVEIKTNFLSSPCAQTL